MGDKTGISWTDATWNPLTGCDRVSPGCANCYALTLAARLQAMGVPGYERDGDPKTSGPGFGLTLHPDRLDQPLRWQRPRRVFVNSMSDLFHPEVPDDFIDRVFAVMALAPQHTFQILTKRPERMREYMDLRVTYHRKDPWSGNARQREVLQAGQRLVNEWHLHGGPRSRDIDIRWPLPNVWLGTSVENARWRTRIDELRQTPATIRFLSCEPLLGPLVCPNCSGWGWETVADPSDDSGQTPMQVPCRTKGFESGHDLDLTGIDWVITGGESGPGARPMDPNWVRAINDACIRQEVAPFVKQLGDTWSRQHLGHSGHAAKPEEWPADLRVQDWPT